MKKKIFFAFLIFNILSFSLNLWASEIKKAFIVDPKTNRKVSVVADEILVKFKPEVEEGTIEGINKKFEVEIKKKFRIKNIYCLKVPPSKTIDEMLKKYREDPNIEYAEPNYIRKAFLTTPIDPKCDVANQWGIFKIQAPEAWDTETGKGSVVIAILDTGVDYDHEDLEDNMWKDSNGYYGYDFVNGDNDPDDDYSRSHGTHCAGIAAAVTNNGIGIAGVSWKSKIMAVKILDDTGSGTLDRELDGINYAVDNGADIISMSFGTVDYPPPSSKAERDAINDAYEKGCLLVAASGNDNQPYVAYPAAYENVIAVGASNASDERCDVSDWDYDLLGNPRGSNYGPELDVVAPGDSILSTVRMGTGTVDPNYDNMDGTSMATPFVSGLAALILSHLPGLAPSDVRRIIERTADDIGSTGWDRETGWGRINAYSALTAYYIAGNIVHMAMNYPNPFKPREVNYTTIYFTTKRAVVDKSIGIYNLAGEMVLSVEGSSIYMDKWYDDGYVYKYQWDGRNDSGERVASGIYVYVVNADGNTKKGKLAVIK
jgi:subtilisin family serine protease